MNTAPLEMIVTELVDDDQEIGSVLRSMDAAALRGRPQPGATENLMVDTICGAMTSRGRGAIVLTEELKRGDHIISAIARTLEWNRIIPHNVIRVETRDGHVRLTGHVHTREEREEAEMLVMRVPGVRDVDNGIEVMTDEMLASELKEAIVKVLLRHTHRRCEGIGVRIRNGRALLTGTVGSSAEKRLVVDTVGWTRHLQGFDDRLNIVTDHS